MDWEGWGTLKRKRPKKKRLRAFSLTKATQTSRKGKPEEQDQVDQGCLVNCHNGARKPIVNPLPISDVAKTSRRAGERSNEPFGVACGRQVQKLSEGAGYVFPSLAAYRAYIEDGVLEDEDESWATVNLKEAPHLGVDRQPLDLSGRPEEEEELLDIRTLPEYDSVRPPSLLRDPPTFLVSRSHYDAIGAQLRKERAHRIALCDACSSKIQAKRKQVEDSYDSKAKALHDDHCRESNVYNQKIDRYIENVAVDRIAAFKRLKDSHDLQLQVKLQGGGGGVDADTNVAAEVESLRETHKKELEDAERSYPVVNRASPQITKALKSLERKYQISRDFLMESFSKSMNEVTLFAEMQRKHYDNRFWLLANEGRESCGLKGLEDGDSMWSKEPKCGQKEEEVRPRNQDDSP